MDGLKFKGTVLCRKLPPEILNDLYESSQQSGRKHDCTPLKGSTSKRRRLLSPGTSSSISWSYDTDISRTRKTESLIHSMRNKIDRLILCIHKYVLNSQVLNDGRKEI
jgi:hypothetical protein